MLFRDRDWKKRKRRRGERGKETKETRNSTTVDIAEPELTMGQWVMYQMVQQIWVGLMDHGSVPVTR